MKRKDIRALDRENSDKNKYNDDTYDLYLKKQQEKEEDQRRKRIRREREYTI